MTTRATPEKHAALVEEIRRVSAEHNIPISAIYRDGFRQLSPLGTTGYVQLAGVWTRAKREALGESVDYACESPPVAPVPEGMHLKGVSTLQGPDGEIKAQWTLARQKEPTREEILERLLLELPEKIPIRQNAVASPRVDRKDLLAVYPIGDPHLGMLTWSRETLDADYDLDIARRLLEGAVIELTSGVPRTSHALVANLGDFFHSDNQTNRTSRSGNALDVDSRWAKILGLGIGVMIHVIDRCLQVHDTVRVINEIGNHDDHSAIMLSIALDHHYSREPRVEVDMSPARFHYHRFGRVLLGITHGHAARKPEDLESIMAHDCAADWSETEHRHWLTGHIHHAVKRATRNCTTESFSTLAPKDAWHSEQGYRGPRDMSRIVYHREHGEIARTMVSARYLEERNA